MAITRLKRKERRNRSVAHARIANMKLLTKVPVIKKVDIEELRKLSKPSLKAKAGHVLESIEHAAEGVVDKVKKAVKNATSSEE